MTPSQVKAYSNVFPWICRNLYHEKTKFYNCVFEDVPLDPVALYETCLQLMALCVPELDFTKSDDRDSYLYIYKTLLEGFRWTQTPKFAALVCQLFNVKDLLAPALTSEHTEG